MSSGLIDTEAGGETPQYESIQTVTRPHSKQGGQLGAEETQPDAVTSQQDQLKAERGEQTAENVRYGQTISEEGMGGKTTEVVGNANRDGLGPTDTQGQAEDAEESRRDQGYGPGSAIGA